MSSKWAVRVPHLSAVVQFVSSNTIYWRLEEHIGTMDTQKKGVKKKSNWLAVTSAYILHHALQVQLISQQWKRILKKNQLKNWINALFFRLEWLCLLLPCPITWVAGPSPHAAHPQRKGRHWKLPISDGGHHCLRSTLRRQSEEGDTAKNLGIEYIILYIISMTQNVNRFIYSPMFKYICRLYTNSLENETANASFFLFFFLPTLFFLNLIFWRAMVKRQMRRRPCDAVEGIQRYKKVHSLKWAICFAMTKNKALWLPSCCIRRLREKEERLKKKKREKEKETLHCTLTNTYCLNSLRYL